jgi:transposase
MSAGTLAGGLQALAPLFQPLDQALLDKLRSEPHWHADETRWAVFIEVAGKVGHRWYLWVFHSSSVVHYVLDSTRAAQVIQTELAGVDRGVISCDRYSGYKRFARLNPGVALAYCWAHQRRDFLDLANSYPDTTPRALTWVDAIGELYHLNASRLRLQIDTAERATAQNALEQAVNKMAMACASALADPELFPPCDKVLQSMSVHWSGLTVFVNSPWVPMDNNTAERDMRGPVVGRKNFYGSGSECSAELAARMYSLMATLKLWRINARTWLGAYLQACADNVNQAPRDLKPFLPWAMDANRLAAMRACPTTLTEELNSS